MVQYKPFAHQPGAASNLTQISLAQRRASPSWRAALKGGTGGRNLRFGNDFKLPLVRQENAGLFEQSTALA